MSRCFCIDTVRLSASGAAYWTAPAPQQMRYITAVAVTLCLRIRFDAGRDKSGNARTRLPSVRIGSGGNGTHVPLSDRRMSP